MESVFFQTENGRVHGLKFGSGGQLLIAFHGFADRAQLFRPLEHTLSRAYTTIALDLPFHGQTEWQKPIFSKADLCAIIAQVLESEGKTRCDLMGFSFGARLLQAILPQLGTKVDQIYLLAPDGMDTRGMQAAFWTPNWVRRGLFRLLQRPAWFIFVLNIGQKLSLLSSPVHSFILRNLSNPARLKRLFGCWYSLNAFRMRKAALRRALQQNADSVVVIFGDQDPILRQNRLKAFYATLPNAQLIVLNQVGHKLIGDALKTVLAKQIHA